MHSDRGTQFASAAFRHTLVHHQLIASMSRKGNCYDNAFIESFWSGLKYSYPSALDFFRRYALRQLKTVSLSRNEINPASTPQ